MVFADNEDLNDMKQPKSDRRKASSSRGASLRIDSIRKNRTILSRRHEQFENPPSIGGTMLGPTSFMMLS
jgi:hypothetical protein